MATAVKTNRLDLTKKDYAGGKSTLCAGCGHNAISAGKLLKATTNCSWRFIGPMNSL